MPNPEGHLGMQGKSLTIVEIYTHLRGAGNSIYSLAQAYPNDIIVLNVVALVE